MEQLILTQLGLLPENLQLEALHYIQFLVEKSARPAAPRPKTARAKKPRTLTFADFRFPTGGQTFSRSEIYGNDGR